MAAAAFTATPVLAQTGQIQQPVVVDREPISTELQRTLGLVTVGDRCSGVLLNEWWVLSAAHCWTGHEQLAMPVTLEVSFTWLASPVPPIVQSVPAAALYSSWGHRTERPATTYDHLLIRLSRPIPFAGSRPAGIVPAIDTAGLDIMSGSKVRLFGRGINRWAVVNPDKTVTQGSGDNKYRTIDAQISGNETRQTPLHPGGFTSLLHFPVTTSSSIAGGDSGGPGYSVDPTDGYLRLVGVHSLCSKLQCAPGKDCTRYGPSSWIWYTGVNEGATCSLSPIGPVRRAIADIIRQEWDPRQAIQRLQVAPSEGDIEPDLSPGALANTTWAMAMRAAQKRCVNRGFYAGVFTGEQGADGTLALVCFGLAAMQFTDMAVGPSSLGRWQFADPEATGWAYAGRSAAQFCGRTSSPGGFHTGFGKRAAGVTGDVLGTVCLKRGYATWMDQPNPPTSGYTDLAAVYWADGARRATSYCHSQGYANGGFLTGHQAPGKLGTVCIGPRVGRATDGRMDSPRRRSNPADAPGGSITISR